MIFRIWLFSSAFLLVFSGTAKAYYWQAHTTPQKIGDSPPALCEEWRSDMMLAFPEYDVQIEYSGKHYPNREDVWSCRLAFYIKWRIRFKSSINIDLRGESCGLPGYHLGSDGTCTLTKKGFQKCSAGNPVNIATGTKYQRFPLYAHQNNSELGFTYHYNSASKRWRHNYEHRLFKIGDHALAIDRADGARFEARRSGTQYVLDPDFKVSIEEFQDGGGSTFYRYHRSSNVDEVYDSLGRLVRIEGPSITTLQLVWSGYRLLSVNDAFGNTLQFTYNGAREGEPPLSVSDGVRDQIYIEYQTFNNDPFPGSYNYNITSVKFADDTPGDIADNPTRQYLYEDSRFPHALTGIINENGERYATWTYDDQGRAVSSAHANGAADNITLAYNADGTTTVTNALGKQTTYRFDVIHGVHKVTQVEGHPTANCAGASKNYTYDANGFLSSKTDWNGNTTTYTHNARGLETSRTEASGTAQARTITTEWHTNFRLPTRISEPGKETTYTYDGSGRLLTQTERDLSSNDIRTWSYTYNAHGMVESIDGPRTDVTDVTTFGYDAQGNRTSITNALGHVTQISAHDASGRPLTIIDPNGLTTQLAYDPRGRLITRTTDGLTTTFGYDGVGNLTSVTLPDTSTLTYTYDAANRLIAIEDALGNRIDYTLDALGNRLQEEVRDPSSLLVRSQSRVFDELSRMLQSIGAASQTTSYSYDPNGNTLSITDANNHATAQAFDALNRLTQVTDAANGVTSYGYDSGDRLTAVTDPNGNTTTYHYDGLGNLLSQSSPDTGATTYTYDDAGNRLTQTDARLITITYEYDALNRLTNIHYPNAALDVTYTYDQGTYGIRRLTGIVDASGTSTFQYDIRGNLIGEIRAFGSVNLATHYGYDSVDRLVSITYPSGRRIDYIRDTAGRITKVTLTDGMTVTTLASNIQYLPFGPLKSLTPGNGAPLSRQYDLDYQLTSVDLPQGMAWTYAADPVGNILSRSEGTNATRYTYDPLDRLIIETGSLHTDSYTYDAVGNRENFTRDGQPLDYLIDAVSNRLNQVGTETRAHDATGNTTSDRSGSRTFSYNDAGRLTQVRENGQLLATYTYNALGQRVTKTTPQGTRYYLYDSGGQLLGEYDQSGQPTKEYVYLNNEPIAQLDGNVTYLHTDHLGTSRRATDETGQVVWQWDSSAFGIEPPNEDPDNDGQLTTVNLRFPGQYYDGETGLHYNYYRYYDPSTGRYITHDPLGVLPGLSPTPNLPKQYSDYFQSFTTQQIVAFGLNQTYAYVESNPLRFIDPLGLNPGMGGGTTSCAHYDMRCEQSGGNSAYYCSIAPLACNYTPDSEWTRCVRQCLQDFDRACGRDSCGGPNTQCTIDAHAHCWLKCGGL